MKKTLLFITIVIISITASAQLAIKYTPIVFARNMKYTFHLEYMIPNTPRISIAVGFSQNIRPRWGIWNDETLGNSTYFQLNQKNSNAGFSIDPEIRFYDGWTGNLRNLLRDERASLGYSGNIEGLYFGFYSSQRFSNAQLDEYKDYILNPTDSTYAYSNPTGGIQNLNTYIAIYGIQIGRQQSLGLGDRLLFDAYVGAGAKLISRSFDNGNGALIEGFESTFEKDIALRANVSLAWRFRRKA